MAEMLNVVLKFGDCCKIQFERTFLKTCQLQNSIFGIPIQAIGSKRFLGSSNYKRTSKACLGFSEMSWAGSALDLGSRVRGFDPRISDQSQLSVELA